MKDTGIYGLLAEFDDVNDANVAAKSAYAAGYRKLDAYAPFPVEDKQSIPDQQTRPFGSRT